jgi:hypothetical protein
VGYDTLSQDLGPLHRLQGCGGVDNVTLKYFATQPKFSSKQVRWQDTLALFNVDIWHKPGKENVVPDALSSKRKFDLGAAMMSLPRKRSKTFKRGSSPTSTYEMDYCGISKIGSMFQKGG